MSGNGITERTFICIKPDGVQRGLVGEIIKRFEQKGYRMVAMKFMQEGFNVVKTGRVMLGETNPVDSRPGTIRGDFCVQVGSNGKTDNSMCAANLATGKVLCGSPTGAVSLYVDDALAYVRTDNICFFFFCFLGSLEPRQVSK
ncbi:hypothetical protein NDU88_003732 [Pleurodeles waltl]|uniref:nucleoside-diphosphate kinase n=1 Tax=Pleurodeles waltl TaxID=8319 RepID=A0AAV7M491_PLEWA|nr:hypothetical protein NDU88_003732 [Pleurodeles waltl]